MNMGRAEDIFEKIIKNGEVAIDEFILTRKSEELFLDFKRSADNGFGKVIHQNDRENLAKAISGFGNSEGGVIVWGIDCSKAKDGADVAHSKTPVQNVKRFVSLLEGAVSGCTVPPHTTVKQHDIITGDKGDGFVATLIPKSDHAPHQVAVNGKSQYHYYIRAGSNFEHTPHAVLAGMFGRRPQPNVFHDFTLLPAEIVNEKIKITVYFAIYNKGPGIASDLFININTISSPEIVYNPLDEENWIVRRFDPLRQISMISKPGIRLAPESFVEPLSMIFFVDPPFSNDLIIEGICGCGQAPSNKFRIENECAYIERLYNEFLGKNSGGALTEKDKFNLVKDLLKQVAVTDEKIDEIA